MNDLERTRAALRHAIAGETGLPARQERWAAGHQNVTGAENRALQLPSLPTDPIQTDDGTADLFMLDFSALDGGDVLA